METEGSFLVFTRVHHLYLSEKILLLLLLLLLKTNFAYTRLMHHPQNGRKVEENGNGKR
jgi:hypothetical protein